MARRIPAIVLMSGSIAILFTAANARPPVMGRGNAGPSRSHCAWARTTSRSSRRCRTRSLRDSQRRRNEAPSYTNPILKPEAAKLVKQRYDSCRRQALCDVRPAAAGRWWRR